MNAAKTAQAPPARLSRMTLKSVSTGKKDVPDRILLYGVEGIGKSSWAAASPAPVFIEPERDGTARINTSRFPSPECWEDVRDAIKALATDQHEYKTAVVDTLDAAEAMLWKYICERDKKSSIEDYGFGKGYVAAIDEWRVLLSDLERLRTDRGMGIILIAHSWIKTFKNPEGDDFDRYELKLNNKAGGLLKEWCDAVLFAHYQTYAVVKEENAKAKAKGVSDGARVLHTQRTAAWDAKNRYSLPNVLPLDYKDFAAGVKAHQPADPDKLKISIQAKLDEIADNDITSKVAADVAKAGSDAEALSKIDNRLNATLHARKGA